MIKIVSVWSGCLSVLIVQSSTPSKFLCLSILYNVPFFHLYLRIIQRQIQSLITYKAFFKKSCENETIFHENFCIFYPSVPHSAVSGKSVLNSATSSGRKKFLMDIHVEMEVPPLLSSINSTPSSRTLPWSPPWNATSQLFPYCRGSKMLLLKAFPINCY